MKWTHSLILVILTAVLSVGGTVLIMEKKYAKEESQRAENELVSVSKEGEVDKEKKFVSIVDTSGLGWENPVFSKRIDEWKSGGEPFVPSMVEDVIQQMTHQKIIAKQKEQSIMITPERIDILIQMVEENKDTYELHETYLDILNRWKKGDFSEVDDDHNILMFIQGGKQPEGLATGIASEEQEIDYIFRVFAKEVDKVFGSSEKE
ncbi:MULTISPECIES: DUF6241 domain-containing protein [Lysinibacillus]|uniref:DUF6241 domain-containing protein n=1 Tax=Lysinibacillus TaxID=400634 RepID=UPI00068A9F30|nr:DUF6241 domain-containing protein [Lysinibacillus sphaericus]